MDHNYILQILFLVLLILSFTSGRTLSHDEHGDRNHSQFPNSLEKKAFRQRRVFPSSSTSQTRQQLLNLLRKAYHDGWKPNIKHYIPATRFGRHHR